MAHTKISVHTLVINARDSSQLDPQGLKREIFYSQSMGICELKSQMYESPHGKMLTSTKITVNSLESSQNCRSSENYFGLLHVSIQERGSLLLNIPPGCETLVKENNDSYVLVSQTNMAGSS